MEENAELEKSEHSQAFRLLRIFEAYDLCGAGPLGQLVREEMLVALGKKTGIDWKVVGDDSLKVRRDRVHTLEAYKECWT